MLKLKIQKEPYWLELGYGVKVKVKPCTSAVFYEAKAYMNSKLAELAKVYQVNKAAGIVSDTASDVENPVKREAMADKFLLIGLGIAGILEWNGVMEADEDKAAPLTESKIEELFSNFWVVAENFRHQYCGLLEVLAAEKNASTSALNGTSAMGEPIVTGAEKAKASAHSTSADTQKQP